VDWASANQVAVAPAKRSNPGAPSASLFLYMVVRSRKRGKDGKTEKSGIALPQA